MTHRAREVCDQASPDRSRETDETSGMDLTQRSEGRKTSGREWVWMSGIDLTRGRGKVEGASGRECVWVSGINLMRGRGKVEGALGRECMWVSGIDLTRGRGKVEGASGRECIN